MATSTMLSVTLVDVLALAGATHGAEATLSAALTAIELITAVDLHTFVFAAREALLALGMHTTPLWFRQLHALAFVTSESLLALPPTLAAMHRVAVQVHARPILAAGESLLALRMHPTPLRLRQLLAFAFVTPEPRLALLPTLAAMHRVAVQVHALLVAAAGFLKMASRALRGPPAPIPVRLILLVLLILLHHEPTLTS